MCELKVSYTYSCRPNIQAIDILDREGNPVGAFLVRRKDEDTHVLSIVSKVRTGLIGAEIKHFRIFKVEKRGCSLKKKYRYTFGPNAQR